jgi:16S rRNA processing protein RimM
MSVENKTRPTLLAVGKIVKLFGIRGELKIQSYARAAKEFETLRSVYVGVTDNDAVEMNVESFILRGGDMYVKFDSVHGRETAQTLVGKYLFVDERSRKKLPAGVFFVDDIIGISVVNEAGQFIGVVKEVIKSPAHDIYLVQTANADVMMPAVPAIVRSVDLQRRIMTVDPPEGLFYGETA